ncbi:MAG: hypothetical protein ACYTE1_06005 [Planctomycetota bacterium]
MPEQRGRVQTGRPVSSEVPLKWGPRNCGQSAAKEKDTAISIINASRVRRIKHLSKEISRCILLTGGNLVKVCRPCVR